MTDRNNEPRWHALEPEKVFDRLKSSPSGLNRETAAQRLRNEGPNSLEKREGRGLLRLLGEQFHNPLIYLLIIAAGISLAAGHELDAGVIAGVVILNVLLGFIQEWRSEKALEALREMAAPAARVIRNGEEEKIDASELVPGDILILKSGDRVGADARITECENLETDESALTGESHPASKETESLDEDTPLADRKNMVWMSTAVRSGTAKAVVVETGMDTAVGKIAGHVHGIRREETPLQKRIQKLGIILGITGIVLAAGVFFLGLLRGFEFEEMLLYSVALSVAAIPEGLPAVITVTLALGVRRMAGHNAIIRRLPAVETLGSTTVICSDKTGTITENRMTVKKIWAGGNTYRISGTGYEPEGDILIDEGSAMEHLPVDAEELLKTGCLANRAGLKRKNGEWFPEGDRSEAALLTAARKGGIDPTGIREEMKELDELPFSRDRMYMATLNTGKDGTAAMVKGAPEHLLEFSDRYLKEGQRLELTEKVKVEIEKVIDGFAGEGLRLMMACRKEFEKDKDSLTTADTEEGLTVIGLWGMMDPTREECESSVESARNAGIIPVLITGDFKKTALAVARKTGIARGDKSLGPGDIERKDKPELARNVLETGVIARVSPRHKLKIMESLKEKGHIVAMTGDGVNDAPALKGVHIGVAMGKTGTEAAREAADMILTDDNFATIVHAVEEGRSIYRNLRKVLYFLLATNLGEVLTLSGALVIGLDLPLTAVMILWINLITEGACTIPLGVEPVHRDVLDMAPRKPDSAIIDLPMVRRMCLLMPLMAVGTLGLFCFQTRNGDLALGRTTAFTALAAFEWFQAFNARSQYKSVLSIGIFSNRWLLLGVGLAVILQALVVYTPAGHLLFGTVSLSPVDWLMIIAVSCSIWVADEIMKKLGFHGKPRGS